MKRNKYIVPAVLSAAMCLSTLAFAACDNKTDDIVKVEGKAPTCTEVGNVEYYTDGQKYYSDAAGKTEITLESTVLGKLPHTPASAYSSGGGYHWHACTVCSAPADEKTAHSPAEAWMNSDTEHWHDCTVCGDSMTKTAHEFEWVTDTAPTETTPGTKHEACGECGRTRNENTAIPPTGSGETEAVRHPAVPATCVDDGTIEYWEKGGKKYADAECTRELDSVVAPATGVHTDGVDWQSGDGKHWKECTVCHTHMFEAAHDKGENAQMQCDDAAHWYDCEACGEDLEKTAHTPAESWKSNDSKHWHNCEICDFGLEKTDHSFAWVTDKEPTDTEPGKKHEECECGRTRNGDTEIPALGVIVHHEAKAATCVEEGNTEYWEKGGKFYKNAECTEEFGADESYVIPATGEHTGGVATCTDKAVCDVCHNEYGELADHDYTVETAEYEYLKSAADCENAAVYYKNCAVCGTASEGDTFTSGEALGHLPHESVYVPGEDGANGKFYNACPRCGEDGKTEVGVYGDRKVTVNGIEYTSPYDCYSEGKKNNGVTYDAINQLFVVHLDGEHFADGVTIAGDNNEVAVSVDADCTVAFIKFTNGFRKLDIIGKHKLTLSGNLESEAQITTVKCDMEIQGAVVTNNQQFVILSGNVVLNGNNGDGVINGTANNITVGCADGSTAPTLTVNGFGSAGINTSGFNAFVLQLLSGETNIIQKQDAAGNCGISLHNAGDAVTVGEHATLNVTGFAIAVVAWDDGAYHDNIGARLNVYGTANLASSAGDNEKAIQNMIVTVGDAERAGTLKVLSKSWGVVGGTFDFVNGSAVIERDGADSGYAAFNGVSKLAIKSGFLLKLVRMSTTAYGGTPEAEIDEGVKIQIADMRDSGSAWLKEYFETVTE